MKLSNSNININNKTAINTKKVLKKYNETSNNINRAINRNSHNKINIKKEVNNNKMTNNKISLITELNKLKLKVKANNQNSQIFQKNRKQSKNK